MCQLAVAFYIFANFDNLFFHFFVITSFNIETRDYDVDNAFYGQKIILGGIYGVFAIATAISIAIAPFSILILANKQSPAWNRY